MGGKKIWLLLFVLVIVVGLAILFGAALIYVLQAPPSIARETVVEVALGGTISEIPPSDPWSLLLEPKSQNLWDLRRALEHAAEDDRVTGMFLEISPLLASWAQIEEMRDAIGLFTASGKPVVAFLSVDIVGEKELYLAAAADEIALSPTTGFLVNGLMAEVVFMKRTFDKLGIKPQFIHFKEYKSAETYTREEMTPEIRSMLTEVLTDVQDRFLETVANDRGIGQAELRALMERGLFSAETAEAAGLVDSLVYRHEAISRLAPGEDEEEYEGVSYSDYLGAIRSPGPRRPKARIAYVGAVGTIVTGRGDGFSGLLGSTTLTSRLRQLRDDSNVDAVILRVDSPGGSAVASDMIWEEVRRLEEAGKPVVVSMSGTAASGGYYISMVAGRIVAQPSTITGSIGVIFGKFDLSGLYDWLGMDVDRIKLSPNSDLFSFTSSLTPEQEKQVTEWIERTYVTFVGKAAEGRNQSYDQLEAKARGRIYTGAQAIDEGLIDSLGGVSAAVAEVRKALNLTEDDPVRVDLYPRPRTLWQQLASGDFLDIGAGMTGWLRTVKEEFQRLERPAVWLLAPEFEIR